MPSALYYPHTTVLDAQLLKTGLLLWDSLECIAPDKAWTSRPKPKDKLLAEASDLILRQHVPSEMERRRAHDEVAAFFNSEASASFAREALKDPRSQQYMLYYEKFGEDTWALLSSRGVLSLQHDPFTTDVAMPRAVGLLLMSFLADACAGGRKQKITDRVDAYAWLEEFKANTLGATYARGLDIGQVTPDYERLVTLSLNILDGRSIPLKRLVDFRKREQRTSGHDYRSFRHRYLRRLTELISTVRRRFGPKVIMPTLWVPFAATWQLTFENSRGSCDWPALTCCFRRTWQYPWGSQQAHWLSRYPV